MERASLLRWVLIGVAVLLFVQFGLPLFTGSGTERQPLVWEIEAPKERTEEQLCDVHGPRFHAQLSSRGASLKHLWMEDAKYRQTKGAHTGEPIDLVTTSQEYAMPLRTNFRVPGDAMDQVAYDDFDWKVEKHDEKSCTFVYEDERARLTKVVSAGERPFELTIAVDVENRDKAAQRHRLTVGLGDYYTDEQTSGSLGRTSEHHTRTEAYTSKTVRHEFGDFDPDDFGDKEFTGEKWRRAAGNAEWAAISSSFFSKALFPMKAAEPPAAEMLIEQNWDASRYPKFKDDPAHGHVYRSRLAYPAVELEPGAKASYELAAYMGPKERQTLGMAVGGDHHAVDLLDLGFFGWIGKLLVHYLYFLHGLTTSWGFSICLLTITVKLLLFPLSITQIKSSMAMRKLKPQMDELNAKYKDDATQRGLALQELWRKNNVTNPMLGCLPVLLQMPVWFALYTSLQTAVELYHTPFGPIIPDLSAPGLYYIIPVVLGLSSLLQQHLMPMQGDPMQQKMMKYMMPAMFTVFMLFLPAGLGIYFLTNTWLGILQQLAVERYYRSQDQASKGPSTPADADVESKHGDKHRKTHGSAKRAKPETA